MTDHSNMSPLFHKARTAFLGAYEHYENTRVVSQEHKAYLVESCRDEDNIDDLAGAINMLMALAALNVDPASVIGDILLAAEFDPDAAAEKAVRKIVETHLMDAGFVAP